MHLVIKLFSFMLFLKQRPKHRINRDILMDIPFVELIYVDISNKGWKGFATQRGSVPCR